VSLTHRLSKVRFAERLSLNLRLEAFGVTNKPQFFFAPNGGTANGTTLGSTSFGHVTSATGGGTLQLGPNCPSKVAHPRSKPYVRARHKNENNLAESEAIRTNCGRLCDYNFAREERRKRKKW